MENLAKNNFSKLHIIFTFLLFSLNPYQSYCQGSIENVKAEQEITALGNTMTSSELTFYGNGSSVDKEFHYLLENNPRYTMELSVALDYFWCGGGTPSLYIQVDSHDSGNEGKGKSWDCGVGVKNYTLKDAKTVTIQLSGRWEYGTQMSLTVTAYHNTQGECPEEFNFDCHYPFGDSVLGHHCIDSKLECNDRRNCYSTDEDERRCDIIFTEWPDWYTDDLGGISTVMWIVIVGIILLLIGGIVCCCTCCCAATFGLANLCSKCRGGSDQEMTAQNDSNFKGSNASNINPAPVISYIYNETYNPVEALPAYDQAVVINSEKDAK